ncbi:MAG: glutamate synthase [Thermofilum sp. ex4484_15]|nr:MAG: glutamate synthase [Thermofilum sp. ex4484_15]
MFSYKVSIKVRGSVAVVGAGPAGLKAAGTLASANCEVDVYDSNPEPGGLLIFGIPSFRINKDKVIEGIEKLEHLGVKFFNKVKVTGKFLRELLTGYDAVLIATGAWEPRKLNLRGVELSGVYYAFDYLVSKALSERGYLRGSELPRLGRRVAVIGGGLTAVDACLTALKEGVREVYLLYRRTKEYAPAGKRELEKLEEEGIRVIELAIPKEILGKAKVEGVRVAKAKLAELDESGRPKPIELPGSEYVIGVDSVLVAIGEKPTPPPSITDLNVRLGKGGEILVDDKYMTTREGIFAAGDVVSGPSRIGLAMKSGLKAALSLINYLKEG